MISTDEAPLRVILFGQQFAAVDDAELMGFSASGPGCLQTLALRLMQTGHDADRPVCLYRGGQHIGKTTLAAAANNEHNLRSEH